jgi:3-isopropylmalate/(R)-2-methylmalate dehydratase small subunit
MQGKVWKFGDNINTDIISPPQYMELSIAEAAQYAMRAVSPTFAAEVRPGDIFVAEHNLGSGSSRETSPLTLKHLGIQAVVAQSFARIFYRNCINLGIPAIECAQADNIQMHDQIQIEEGKIINLSREECYPCSLLPENILAMIKAGGLVPYLQQLAPHMKGAS